MGKIEFTLIHEYDISSQTISKHRNSVWCRNQEVVELNLVKLFQGDLNRFSRSWCNIQTWEIVFHQDIQTLTTKLKIHVWYTAEYFWRNWRCLRADETLSRLFDVPSQSKQNKDYGVNCQNLVLYANVETSFTVVVFFVLTRWIINKFEKGVENSK